MKEVLSQIYWGKDNEDRAWQCYIENRQQYGEDMEAEISGSHIMPDKSFIGAYYSHGKVLCRNVDTCIHGCLESKCSYSINGQVTVSMTPTEIVVYIQLF